MHIGDKGAGNTLWTSFLGTCLPEHVMDPVSSGISVIWKRICNILSFSVEIIPYVYRIHILDVQVKICYSVASIEHILQPARPLT